MEPVGRFLLGWRKPSTLSASTLNVVPDKTHRIDVLLVDLVVEPDLVGSVVERLVENIMVPFEPAGTGFIWGDAVAIHREAPWVEIQGQVRPNKPPECEDPFFRVPQPLRGMFWLEAVLRLACPGPL